MKFNCIEKVLDEKERTKAWLSRKVKKSKATISNWCINATQPNLKDLFLIAFHLDTTINELIVKENPFLEEKNNTSE